MSHCDTKIDLKIKNNVGHSDICFHSPVILLNVIIDLEECFIDEVKLSSLARCNSDELRCPVTALICEVK